MLERPALDANNDHAKDFQGFLKNMGPLAEKMGIEVIELSPEYAEATIPVEGNTQYSGVVHGGAYAMLGETLGSLSASVHAGPEKRVLGIELNASHHRGTDSGKVTAKAKALHLGRTLATHEITLWDDHDRHLSTVRMTNIIIDA